MLEAHTLKKSYGKVTAVDGVSLHAHPGEIIGLLGPNGAGKTTTVSMIAGLVRPDSGSVKIDGWPITGDTDPNKRCIGLVPQDLALFDELPAQENLLLFAALYKLDGKAARRAIAEALALVGLADRVRDRVRTFSGGMKRRLNLAAALLHDPQITHYMEEAERLCDRIIVIDHGKVVAETRCKDSTGCCPLPTCSPSSWKTDRTGCRLTRSGRFPAFDPRS